MRLRNRFLSWLIPFVLLAANSSLSAKPNSKWHAPDDVSGSPSFVVYQNELGEVTCREATELERRQIAERSGGGATRVIYPGAPLRSQLPYGTETWTPKSAPDLRLQPSAGLHIVLHGTAQLDQNPSAKNAFIVAANRWEAIVSTSITVVIDVDFGPTFFGEPYPSGVLGATGVSFQQGPYSDLRQRLINGASNAIEQQLYNALPLASVPVDFNGVSSSVTTASLTLPNARALGLAPDIPDPNLVPLGQGDAGIGFNSAFQFDFTPDDGISSGQTDFDSVASHEIGHALGFISESGGTSATPVSAWDLFRFRPATVNLATFTTAPRIMSIGGSQIFFGNQVSTFATLELALSTGGPDPEPGDGDGRQSSHWKDDALSSARPYIGVMDPTLGTGIRRTISENDIVALDLFGYSISLPPPVRPSNDNFVNAISLQGNSGTLNGTNVSATREAGEPNHAGFMGDKSVWYSWLSPLDGQITIDTIGSNYDTTLGVYTGTAVNQLLLIAQNDDIVNGTNKASRVQFNITAGTTYRIAVDGWNGEYGNVTLNWSAGVATPTPTPTPTPTRVLTVASVNPGSGVPVTVSPNDNGGLGNGSTQFTRTYNQFTSVNLTAPISVAGNYFQKWQLDGNDLTTVRATGVNMGIDRTLTAVYITLPPTPTPSPTPTPNGPGQAVAYQINTAHTGSQFDNVSPPLGQRWSRDLGAAVSYPVIAGGKVYVTTFPYLYALDATTGATVWGPIDLVGGTGGGPAVGAAYEAGRIFVVNRSGLLRAFDATTGSQLWSRQLGGQAFSSAPTAQGGTVYVSGYPTVFGVSAQDGSITWSAPNTGGDNSSPSVSETGVFVSYACNNAWALSPATGSVLWHHTTNCFGGGGKTTVLFGGRVYARGGSLENEALDVGTGIEVATFSASPAPAFNGSTGYFLNGTTLEARDVSSGTLKWSFTGDGTIVSAPIVVNGIVYVGSTSGKLYALSESTGANVWIGTVGAPVNRPDEQNVSVLTGLGAGEGLIIVPAGNSLVAYQPIQTAQSVQFSSAAYTVGEGSPRVNVTISRSGDTASSASVTYTTSDNAGSQNCATKNGIASQRCDYINTVGTITIAPGETSKSFSVAIVDDSYAEGSETFTVSLSNPVGATLDPQSTATVTITDNDSVDGPGNPSDSASFFVRQHYIDFLNREPDDAGLAFWTNQITECQQPGATCSAEVRRIN
ncbi:MAG: NF038122 family metalloprotease, partial [Pyrinomonadaceae bacterium]